MTEVLQYAAGVLVIVGAGFSALGALGLVRFPDIYTRLHAASLAGALGVGLIFIAISLVALDAAIVARSLLGLGFVLLTSSLTGHLLARAARKAGTQPVAGTSITEIPPKA